MLCLCYSLYYRFVVIYIISIVIVLFFAFLVVLIAAQNTRPLHCPHILHIALMQKMCTAPIQKHYVVSIQSEDNAPIQKCCIAVFLLLNGRTLIMFKTNPHFIQTQIRHHISLTAHMQHSGPVYFHIAAHDHSHQIAVAGQVHIPLKIVIVLSTLPTSDNQQ